MERVRRAVPLVCALIGVCLLVASGCRQFSGSSILGRGDPSRHTQVASRWPHRIVTKSSQEVEAPGTLATDVEANLSSERNTEHSEIKLVAFEEDVKPVPKVPVPPKDTEDLPKIYDNNKAMLTERLPSKATASSGETLNTDGGSGWTLESIRELALANNPSIAQAMASVRKAEGIRDQASLPPNPSIGYAGDQLGDGGTDINGAFISQDIVLGGKLAHNDHVLSHAVQVQMHEVDVQRQRVSTDVRRIFVDALAAQRRRDLTREFREVAAKGVDLAGKRLRAKEGSKPEVLQAEIQLNQVELALRQAEFALDGAWKQLAAMIGQPDLPRESLVGDLSDGVMTGEDWETKLQGLYAMSPEVRAAEERLHVAKANIDRQQVQWVPNLSVDAAYGYDAGTNGEFARVQLGMPIPLHNANQGNVAAACAEYARATANLERLQTSLRIRWAEIARLYDSAEAAVQRFRDEIVPKAKESLGLSEKAYLAGEFDFLQVLIARRTFFDANLEYVLAQKELALHQASVDGLLLTGGFDVPMEFSGDDGLRGQALSGQ